VLVSFIGHSFLSEVERPSILRTSCASHHHYPIGLPPSRLTPPRSGPERSDFVPWRILALADAVLIGPLSADSDLRVERASPSIRSWYLRWPIGILPSR
jgi:hypothetical protein